MRSTLFALSLWRVLSIAPAVARAENLTNPCFFPDGTRSGALDKFICNPSAEFSVCCSGPDECTTNGLCMSPFDAGKGYYWREQCTDPTWESDDCPHFCYTDKTHQNAPSQNWVVLSCTTTTYCCKLNQQINGEDDREECCGDPDRVFTLGAAKRLAGATLTTKQMPADSTSATRVSTGTGTARTTKAGSSQGASDTTDTAVKPTGTDGRTGTAAGATSTNSNAEADGSGSDSDSDMPQATKVGIGLGVPLGAIVIAGICFMAWRAGKRHATKKAGIPANVNGSYPTPRGYGDDEYYKSAWQNGTGAQAQSMFPAWQAGENRSPNSDTATAWSPAELHAQQPGPKELGEWR